MKFGISLAFLCTFGITTFAQNPVSPGPAAANGPIRLNVTVTPRSGEPVPNLPQSAFTVLDNGRPQPIANFRALTVKDAPVRILFVVDAVNVPYVQLAYERNQIDSFLRANDGKLAQPVGVVVFTDTSLESTGFTTDGNGLSKTLDQKEIGIRELRRSSGFYGAEERLDLSVRALQTLMGRVKGIPGRKAIVWVSPGWPFLSGPNVQLTNNQEQQIYGEIVAASKLMHDANVTLYSVDPLGAEQSPGSTYYYEEFLKPVRKPSQDAVGDLGLQVLALQSGGLALSGSNDVRALLQRCVDDTRAYYEITFTPPPPDAPLEFHKVDVKVSVPGLTARAAEGYYSSP